MRQLAASVIDALATRVELAGTELAEQRLRLGQLALAALVALFLLGNGLVLGLVALAWWAGPAQAAAVLGTGAFGLLIGAGFAIVRWRRLVREQPPLLDATLAQLRADARALSGGSGS